MIIIFLIFTPGKLAYTSGSTIASNADPFPPKFPGLAQIVDCDFDKLQGCFARGEHSAAGDSFHACRSYTNWLTNRNPPAHALNTDNAAIGLYLSLLF